MGFDGFEFGIVGAGWRSDFFLRVAESLPNVRVCGIVVRDAQRAAEVEDRWAVPCFGSIPDLANHTEPSYVIASVGAEAMPEVCLELTNRGLAVLAETPPAPDLESLSSLYQRTVDLGARIQVAEQYWAQPLHAARQAVVDSGVIGPVNQVNVSVCHGYHAMSLIRRLLGAC